MFDAEQRLIAALWETGLLNATLGGHGQGKGLSPTPATRAKISAALAGRPLPPETRAKMSAARTGVPVGPFSESHRANLSAAQHRRFANAAERERIASSARGRTHSPETRQLMRAAQQARRAAERGS
jgi:hypothetical protein